MQAVLQAIDSLDLDGAVALFATEGSLMSVFGDTAAGRQQVRAVLGAFLRWRCAPHTMR